MILDEIVAWKRAEVAAAKAAVPLAELKARLADAPPPRNFAAALSRPGSVHLIAEVKRASPSKGLIRADFDPAAIAAAYAQGGAAALSVLTDRRFFQGDLGFLAVARAAAPLPVLRKDFTVDPYQLYEARGAGADAVLLIAAVLGPDEIRRCLDLAGELGLACLVEAHDLPELDAVIPTGVRLIGINNRNLKTFETTLAVTEALAPHVPPDCVVVSESGIFTRADVARVAAAGARAILVGESLMRSADIAAKVRELVGVGSAGAARAGVEEQGAAVETE
ncbi:MAG: indole-3-glycerol phosphate synthase TrpC [Armatimonadetes bacterium]|nr:indole-3-glycerol phosphate synthase TrpC [Armatimonadota bacterium]